MNDIDLFKKELKEKVEKPLIELFKAINSMGRFRKDAARFVIMEVAHKFSNNGGEAVGLIQIAVIDLYNSLKGQMMDECEKQDKKEEHKHTGVQ